VWRLRVDDAEASCDAEASGLSAEPNDSEESPRVRPRVIASESGAACDGHALHLADLLLLGEPNRYLVRAHARKPAPRTSTIRSLRLRHTTPWLSIPSFQKGPAPAVRCASLSRCCPARRDNLGTAAAALPLHPFHPAARSTIGGRSSPEPAKLTLPPATLSRVRHKVVAACCSLGNDAPGIWPQFPRGRCSVPHSATLGTPSVYLDTAAMSSAMPSVTTSTWLAGGDGSVSQGTQQGYHARNTMSSGSDKIRETLLLSPTS